MSVGDPAARRQLPFGCVNCHCKSRRDLELAPVPFIKFLILMHYFHSGDEYILSSIISFGDRTVEKGVGGINKDEPCIIEKFMLG